MFSETPAMLELGKIPHARKIAVPSMGKTLESFINSNLGRCPFIIIYDNKANNFNCFPNTGFQLQDGSGLKASEIIIQNKANVLLTREIGRKAYSLLVKEHVDIHLLKSTGTVKTVLNKFLKKQSYDVVSIC